MPASFTTPCVCRFSTTNLTFRPHFWPPGWQKFKFDFINFVWSICVRYQFWWNLENHFFYFGPKEGSFNIIFDSQGVQILKNWHFLIRFGKIVLGTSFHATWKTLFFQFLDFRIAFKSLFDPPRVRILKRMFFIFEFSMVKLCRVPIVMQFEEPWFLDFLLFNPF